MRSVLKNVYRSYPCTELRLVLLNDCLNFNISVAPRDRNIFTVYAEQIWPLLSHNMMGILFI